MASRYVAGTHTFLLSAVWQLYPLRQFDWLPGVVQVVRHMEYGPEAVFTLVHAPPGPQKVPVLSYTQLAEQ